MPHREYLRGFMPCQTHLAACQTRIARGRDHLPGQNHPLPARLLAIIDTLNAMTFDRTYCNVLSFDAVKAEIIRISGS